MKTEKNNWTLRKAIANHVGIGAVLCAGAALNGTAVAATPIPATIEAESYLNMSGIQLENSSEGTQNVGWVDTNDWLTYAITVPSAGTYTIQYRVASPNNDGIISSDLNAGTNQLGELNVPNTGGWQNWATITQTVNLPQGTYNLGVLAKSGGFNLNWLKIDGNVAIKNTRADLSLDGYLRAFNVNEGGRSYFRKSLNSQDQDSTWVAALDILAAEDAYERTGRADHKAIVNKLCRTWLEDTPPPWTWDGWNDDIGWFALAMVRGYQMTGEEDYLEAAKYGFDMAWDRGWDTQYNGGGIWEQQPDMTPEGEPISKEALSNDSLGKVAAMLYQSTHDRWYLDRSVQIHEWVVSHIYEESTGRVFGGIDRQDVINKGRAVYNQGTFADYSHLLYLITSEAKYYNYAKDSLDYVQANMTNNGIISNSAGYLNTWADEYARGLGHFVHDNRQWDTYYPWMQQNSNAIWNNRRTDYNITWNGWAEQTPYNDNIATSQFASAVSWFQFTPAEKPSSNIGGIHTIVSKQNDIAIDSAGEFFDGSGVIQWGLNYGQNQKWLFTQNEDASWTITSMSSWKALDVPAGSTDNGTQMVLWAANRNDNQRWWVDTLDDGSVKITNKASGLVLDNSNNPSNGYELIQWGWNGGDQQRWLLQ